MPVIGLGFPDAAKDRTPGSTARDTLPMRGHVDPLAHAKAASRHVVVGLDGPLVPASGKQGSSPWSGASGTALFHNGTEILVAVATTDHELALDARTLTATPVAALPAAQGFAAVAAACGISVEMIDVNGTALRQPTAALPPPAAVPVPAGLSNLGAGQMFVGRVAELDELRAAMNAGPGTSVVTQAIAGLGGIGKTTLAGEYARRHAGDYAACWIVTADTGANVEKGLAGLARRLCPAATAGHDDAALAEWAVAWLQAHPGWLLVWDNVDDLAEVLQLYEVLVGGHHLMTSRRSGGWHRVGVTAPLRLGEFAPDDAMALLAGLTGNGAADKAVAGRLCADLGFLPLAIEQVGAYLAEAGIDAAAYLELWRTANARAVVKASESHPADRVMTVVWQVTLDRLTGTPLAADLLRILAWLAPDGVPRKWLEPLAEDPDAVEAALARLHAYSMVTLAPGGHIGVHRVVQAVARTPDLAAAHRQPEAVNAAQDAAIGMLAALVPARDLPSVDALAKWRSLLPHVDAFAAYTAGARVPKIAIGVMDRAIDFLRGQGNPAAAIRIAACSLAGELAHHGPDHPDTLAFRSNLANAYRSAGDLGRAAPLLEQTLADRTRAHGLDHPDTLGTL